MCKLHHFPAPKECVHINCFRNGSSKQMMTQRRSSLRAFLFWLQTREAAAGRVENCKLGRAHPSPVPPQGQSCNQPHHSLFNVIITIVIITIHNLGIDESKVETSCCPARSLISFSINLNAFVAVNLKILNSDSDRRQYYGEMF